MTRHRRRLVTSLAAAAVLALTVVPLAAQSGQPSTTGTPATKGQPPRDGRGAPPDKAAPAAAKPKTDPAFHVAGFFETGYQGFSASQTFEATLGSAGGSLLGGGASITHRSGLFFQVDVTHFSGEGERAFAYNGEVFPLGIPLEVGVRPIELTWGYKFFMRPPKPKPARPPAKAPAKDAPKKDEHSATLDWGDAFAGQAKAGTPAPASSPKPASAARKRWGGLRPYVGGGLGFVHYTETSDFATTGEDIDESYTSYHVLGGVEVPVWYWLGAGVEVNYRWVKNAFGDAGLSQAFGEDDLGGASFRVKFTIGR